MEPNLLCIVQGLFFLAVLSNFSIVVDEFVNYSLQKAKHVAHIVYWKEMSFQFLFLAIDATNVTISAVPTNHNTVYTLLHQKFPAYICPENSVIFEQKNREYFNPFSGQNFCTKKKAGIICHCVNFRKLDRITVQNESRENLFSYLSYIPALNFRAQNRIFVLK